MSIPMSNPLAPLEILTLACYAPGCPATFLVETERANHHLGAHELPLPRRHTTEFIDAIRKALAEEGCMDEENDHDG